MPEDVKRQNLERLCREITDLHGGERSNPDSDDGKLCRCLADRMPFSHATSLDTFGKVCDAGELLSLEKLHADPGFDWSAHPVETTLNTRSCVFVYAGPFRYPGTACGFLFRPGLAEARRDDGVATPFDSGGLLHHHGPPGNEDPLAFLRRHDLPLPEYREYHMLVLDLLFDDPWHYVDGVAPARDGPMQFVVKPTTDARRWTFEIRLQDRLPVKPHLQAIFVPNTVLGMPSGTKMCSWCRAGGVDIIDYHAERAANKANFRELQRRSESYIRTLVSHEPN